MGAAENTPPRGQGWQAPSAARHMHIAPLNFTILNLLYILLHTGYIHP